MLTSDNRNVKKINYLSYIRAIACIAIIVLHTVNSALILYEDGITEVQSIVSRSVVYCMMFAVPVFVMVTGALLLQKEKQITLKLVFRKYILRVFLALLIFSVLFSLFDTVMNKDGAGAGFLLRGLWNTLTGRGWAHMWYLYLLIGLYLMLIFYRAAANHVSEKEYRYLLLVYTIFLSVLPILDIWNVKVGFYIHTATIYPFYLFAGYAIVKGKIKIQNWLCVLLMVIGIAGLIASGVWNKVDLRVSYSNLLSYSSIFVLLLSTGLFSLFKNNFADKLKITKKAIDHRTTVFEEKKPNVVGRVLLELDRCSFGVYLIHMIFLRLVLRYWQINPFTFGSPVLIFAGIVIAVLLVSYGATFLLKLIPGVRRIL